MSELSEQLDQGSAEQPAWEGRTDVHYIFLWNSNRLRLVNYEVISCGITEHPNRRAQYFELHSTENDFPLHLYHNHSPSPHLTVPRRKTIVRSFWNHVITKSSVAQPAVVFGGDFNCTSIQWTQCLSGINDSQASRRTVQACHSKAIPRQGDIALAINAIAFTEDSRCCVRATTTHHSPKFMA